MPSLVFKDGIIDFHCSDTTPINHKTSYTLRRVEPEDYVSEHDERLSRQPFLEAWQRWCSMPFTNEDGSPNGCLIDLNLNVLLRLHKIHDRRIAFDLWKRQSDRDYINELSRGVVMCYAGTTDHILALHVLLNNPIDKTIFSNVVEMFEKMLRELHQDQAAYHEKRAKEAVAATTALTAKRIEAEAKADAERQRRRAIHDAMMAAQEAEAKAAALRRKLHAIEARKLRAAEPAKPFTAYREPPCSKKAEKKAVRSAKRAGDRERATGDALAHEIHVLPEQRELREDAFNARQLVEHAEKLAREAKEKVERLRAREAAASAAREAAVHVVPTPATIDDALAAAMCASELG